MRAWVAFTGKTDLPWLKVLKKGFRHCFVVLHDGRRWISVDPLAGHTDIIVHDDLPPDFELTEWLKREGGCRVLPAPLNRTHTKPAPMAAFSCVEAVKRVLGLHERWIFTPWQLYKHLTPKKGD